MVSKMVRHNLVASIGTEQMSSSQKGWILAKSVHACEEVVVELPTRTQLSYRPATIQKFPKNSPKLVWPFKSNSRF